MRKITFMTVVISLIIELCMHHTIVQTILKILFGIYKKKSIVPDCIQHYLQVHMQCSEIGSILTNNIYI